MYVAMKRKLASIQKIATINPIKGADSIESATVMGWNIVVKKGQFAPGDRCVFFEIDSILPEDQRWAEFMRPRGFRVKTARLLGTISQGLALPLHILPRGDHGSYRIDDDVTDVLGVRKYEPPAAGPDAIGPFPGDVPKTDEMRLQSVLPVLDELRGRAFYVTVKLDGMSGTFIRRDDCLQVCSRNMMIREGTGTHWTVAQRYDLATVLPPGFAVQGEVVGPSIQGNKLKLSEPDLFIFNVYDIGAGKFLDYDGFITFCHKHGLKTVPIDFTVEGDELTSFEYSLNAFLTLAEGKYIGTTNNREGIVVRPQVESYSPTLGGRLSFKVISNTFLLHDED